MGYMFASPRINTQAPLQRNTDYHVCYIREVLILVVDIISNKIKINAVLYNDEYEKKGRDRLWINTKKRKSLVKKLTIKKFNLHKVCETESIRGQLFRGVKRKQKQTKQKLEI